jgi:phage shock protein C
MNSRLYRSNTDAMIGGVCGGLGSYLGIDTLFVRIFFVLLALGNGIGVLIYFLLWIIVPLEGQPPRRMSLEHNVRMGSQEIAERTRAMGEDIREFVRRPNPQAAVIIGAVLIFVGVIYLIENLHLPWLRWLNFDVLWPVLLILGGLALILRRSKGD